MAAGGVLLSRKNSPSPKYVLASAAAGASVGRAPQKPSNFDTTTSPCTHVWQARRRFGLSSCGGKLRRSLSRAEASGGSTSPRTSTAHVPHVPRPRQLINCELLLCGERPRRSNAVRSNSPRWTSMTRVPSAVVQVMLHVSVSRDAASARVTSRRSPDRSTLCFSCLDGWRLTTALSIEIRYRSIDCRVMQRLVDACELCHRRAGLHGSDAHSQTCGSSRAGFVLKFAFYLCLNSLSHSVQDSGVALRILFNSYKPITQLRPPRGPW